MEDMELPCGVDHSFGMPMHCFRASVAYGYTYDTQMVAFVGILNSEVASWSAAFKAEAPTVALNSEGVASWFAALKECAGRLNSPRDFKAASLGHSSPQKPSRWSIS
jgi:hypothetical protein